MRTFDLDVYVSAVPENGDLTISVYGASPHDADLDIDFESDAALSSQVLPTGVVVQVPRLAVFVDDEEITPDKIGGETSVELDYDNLTQGWEFTTPLESPAGVFGTPFACYGPAMGKKRIDIFGVYRPSSGDEILIPLIKDGVVDNSNRESGPDGILERFTGVDGMGRIDGKKITLQFPPGHGLSRGRVLREVFKALGDTKYSFEDGGTMFKELQLIDTEPLNPCQEIMETEDRKLFKDSDGFSINPKIGPVRPDEDLAFSFEEKDVLQVETVSLDPQANVITLVVANGTEQITEEACGERVEFNVVIDYAEYSPKASVYQQSRDGAGDPVYTPLNPPDLDAELIPIRRTETTRKYRCEEMYEELVRIWEWRRNEVPRWEWDDDSGGIFDWRALSGRYTDDDDGLDEGGPAYAQTKEVFTLISETRRFNIFAHEDFTGPVTTNSGLWLPLWNELVASGRLVTNATWADQRRYGQAIGYLILNQEFTKLFGAVRVRSAGEFPRPSWDDTPPEVGTLLWGDGNGVGNLDMTNIYGFIGAYNPPPNYEAIMPFSATVGVFSGDDFGYLNSEAVYLYGQRAKRGVTHFYGENDTRGEESEVFRQTDFNTIDYLQTADTHTKAEKFLDTVTGRKSGRTETGIPGDRPAVERLDSVPVNPDIYEGEEISDLPRNARRRETKQITVTVPFDFLLTCHLPREIVTEFPWAENEEEIRAMAEMLARDSSAMPVRWTLPANFLIRPTHAVHFTYRPLGIDHDIRVKNVRWAKAPNEPLLTRVEGRLYPW